MSELRRAAETRHLGPPAGGLEIDRAFITDAARGGRDAALAAIITHEQSADSPSEPGAGAGSRQEGRAASLEDRESLGGGVALVLLGVGHYVVVASVSEEAVVVFDPAVGVTQSVARADVQALSTGRVFFLAPGPAV